MAFFYSPNVVTDGLVFAVDAANKKSYPGSGTTWTDLAGSNNGTLTNGPTFDSGNGGSIVFDNTDDIILCGSSNNVTGDNLQTCTLAAWFKTTTTGRGYIASIKRQSTPSTLITISVNTTGNGQETNGVAGLMTRDYANTNHVSITTNNNGNGWNDGQWHYLVGTVNSSTRIMYIDGVQQGTDTNGMQEVTGNTADFTIGGFATSGFSNQFYEGNIANVSFYTRALSSTEITQNYNALKSRFGL